MGIKITMASYVGSVQRCVLPPIVKIIVIIKPLFTKVHFATGATVVT